MDSSFSSSSSTAAAENLFTFEYNSEGAGGADFCDNNFTQNFNHFDGEVPLPNPTNIVPAPTLELMRNLYEAEQRFWINNFTPGSRRSRRNNFYQKKYGSSSSTAAESSVASADIFKLNKCCPQGYSLPSKEAVDLPGRYHSCPYLHLDGDCFVESAGAGSAHGGSTADSENKIESRVQLLKELKGTYGRKEKGIPASACKVCSTFRLPMEDQQTAESIYETYKRNCTYGHLLQGNADNVICDPAQDPAESIKVLFARRPHHEPTNEELAKALLPGPLSPSTPSDWFEQLLDMLDPNPKPNPPPPVLEISTMKTSKSNVQKLKKYLAFPKLKKSKARHQLEIGTPIAPPLPTIAKLLRARQKLMQVKSRYLDVFLHPKKDTQGQSATEEGFGDSAQVGAKTTELSPASKPSLASKSGWNFSSHISRGDGDNANSREARISRIPLLAVPRLIPTSRYNQKSSKRQQIQNAKHKKSGAKLSKKRLVKLVNKPPKTTRRRPLKKQEPKSKSTFSSPKPTKSTRRRHHHHKLKKVVRQACGFEFDEKSPAEVLGSLLPYQCLPPRKKRTRRRTNKSGDPLVNLANLFVEPEEAVPPVDKKEAALEKYKLSILKMLEKGQGDLLGSTNSTLTSSSSSTSPSTRSKPTDVTERSKPNTNKQVSITNYLATSRSSTVFQSKENSTSRPSKSTISYYHRHPPTSKTDAIKSSAPTKQQSRLNLLPLSARIPIHHVQLELDVSPDFKPQTIPIAVKIPPPISIFESPSRWPSSSSSSKQSSTATITNTSISSSSTALSKFSLYYPLRRHSHSHHSHHDSTSVPKVPNSNSRTRGPLPLSVTEPESLESVVSTRKLIPIGPLRTKSREHNHHVDGDGEGVGRRPRPFNPTVPYYYGLSSRFDR